MNALQLRNGAVGTGVYEIRHDECSRILLGTYRAYLGKAPGKLQSLPSSSKGWWELIDSLLTKAIGQENISLLQKPEFSWATSATDNAAALSRAFRAKSVLP